MEKKKIEEQLDIIVRQGRTEYNDLLPFIKLADVHCLYLDYGYKTMNQFLINHYGLNKSTVSELIKVSRMFYQDNGKIIPKYEGFKYSVLVVLAKQDRKKVDDLINRKVITPNSTRESVKDMFMYHGSYSLFDIMMK